MAAREASRLGWLAQEARGLGVLAGGQGTRGLRWLLAATEAIGLGLTWLADKQPCQGGS